MRYDPVTLTYPNGCIITLSRMGNIVTAEAIPGSGLASSIQTTAKPIPDWAAPTGNLVGYSFSSPGAAFTAGNWSILIGELTDVGVTGGGITVYAFAFGPYQPFTVQWLADPEPPPALNATPRVWLYRQLTSTPGVADLIGGLAEPRVFAKKTMTSAIEQHPYIVYKLGYNATEDLSEETSPDRQFIQIFVHDYSNGESGDYLKIDQVITAIKEALHLQSSKAYGVMACRYLETSQDLNDETLNTVFKYARFQLITNGV